jgi:hypothetical protein
MTMGRWYGNKRRTVEQCKSISMPFLRRNGYFDSPLPQGIVWTNRFGEETASMTVSVHTSEDEKYIRLMYTMTDRNTGKETYFDYRVELVTTPCNLGGVRYWFICPSSRHGVYCGRRVSVLYRAPRADYFGCRHCYNLSYESRNESRHGRLAFMGRFLTLDRRMKNFREQMRRWTYRGMPTRRARRLYALEAQLDAYGRTYLPDLLRNR